MNNFAKRTISGIGFILITIGALVAGPLTFYLIFALFTGLSLFELYNLAAKNKGEVQNVTGILTGLVAFTLSFLIAGQFIESHWLGLLLPIILLIFIKELYRKKENPLLNISYTLAGLIYPTISFMSLSLLVYLPVPEPGYGHQIIISLFVLIWTNDTFAYLVGKKFGKHKLFERISPKKTWEGLAGGFIFTLLAATAIFSLTSVLNLVSWIILAIIVSVAGTFGDLAESTLKRSAGVKESGNFLPGHGGILDRFDSAIFIFPIAYFYLRLLL